MKEILQESKEHLLKPLSESRREYLIILNIVYIGLTSFFLISERIANGRFVPDTGLYYVYIPAIVVNFLSAIYNLIVFRQINKPVTTKSKHLNYFRDNHRFLDKASGWASIVVIMAMSFFNMIGFGNPSNDALLTDFAMAHALIVTAVILVGRTGAFTWSVIVLGVLVYHVHRLGFDFQFHYLTPSEATRYETALVHKEAWALKRQAELNRIHFNPPSAARYMNIWAVFILMAGLTAYFFGGVILKIYSVIPQVIKNIETVIQSSLRISFELEHKRSEVTKSGMRLGHYHETVDQVKKELEKMEYGDRKKFLHILKIMREAVRQEEKETDWQEFAVNFDSIDPKFWQILKEKYSNLTTKEQKHMAYLRMNMSSQEIAVLLNVTQGSLKSMRYQLKNRLKVPEGMGLKKFIDNIETI